MEFGKSTKVSAEDVALADAPRVALQPVHRDIRSQTPTVQDSEVVSGFAFEQESTAEAAIVKPAKHPHHSTAVIVSICVTAVFVGAIAFFYFLR